jgi:hypothetical protein
VDYQGNPNKEPKPEKKVEKVVTGEVVQKPLSPGQKFKRIFFGGDLKSAGKGVAEDVIFPSLRDMVWDTVSSGARKWIYGESYKRRVSPNSSNYSYGPRTEYHSNPLYPRSVPTSSYPSIRRPGGPPDQYRALRPERERGDIVLARREDAEVVVENLLAILAEYERATLMDLYDLLGVTASPIDQKWGWTYLGKIEIRQTRDGYVIDLPPLEAV